MAFWRRAILLGVLVWLAPFVVACCVFSLKASSRPLFESIMAVTVAATTVGCGLWYFRPLPAVTCRQGLLLGTLWFAVCVAIDLPLMLSPPINYTLADYAADIGLTYLMIPTITLGMASAGSYACRRGA